MFPSIPQRNYPFGNWQLKRKTEEAVLKVTSGLSALLFGKLNRYCYQIEEADEHTSTGWIWDGSSSEPPLYFPVILASGRYINRDFEVLSSDLLFHAVFTLT